MQVSEQLLFIPASDGTRLACTLYLPEGDGPFATLLEALPYRKDDITSSYADSYRAFRERGRLRRGARRPARHRQLGRCGRGRVPRHRAGRSAHRHRVGRRPALEQRQGRHVRNELQRVQLAAHGDGGSARSWAPCAPRTPPTTGTPTTCTTWAARCGPLDLIDYPLYMIAMNALPPTPAVWGEGGTTGWTSGVGASTTTSRGCWSGCATRCPTRCGAGGRCASAPAARATSASRAR